MRLRSGRRQAHTHGARSGPPPRRRYLLPVKAWLKRSGNKLRITLHPAIKIAIDRKRNHPYWIPTVTVGRPRGPRRPRPRRRAPMRGA